MQSGLLLLRKKARVCVSVCLCAFIRAGVLFKQDSGVFFQTLFAVLQCK